MNRSRVDALLKYILLTAAGLDLDQRSLGPIHLIKYVYLADLAYAKKNTGQTFTGIKWQFFHYGPWSKELFDSLEPLLDSEDINKYKSVSDFDKDFIRWSYSDEPKRLRLEKELQSIWVTATIKRSLKEFGNDTYGLLHYVYVTKPMLKAAPGEFLDFTPDDYELEHNPTKEKEDKSKTLTKEQFHVIKAKLQKKMVETIKENEEEYITIRQEFDNSYYEGIAWLNSLEGRPIEDFEAEIEVSDEIWKMPGRADELP